MRYFRLCLLVSTLIASSGWAGTVLRFASVENAYIQKISEAVVQTAYGQMNIVIEVDWQPPARALVSSNSGRLDGELSRIDELSATYPNLVRVGIPVNFIEATVFKSRSKKSILTWEDLATKRVGMVTGVKFAENALAALPAVKVSSYDSLFKMLQSDRFDYVVAPRTVGMAYLRQSGDQLLDYQFPPLERIPLYHYLHEDNRHLVPALESVLQKMTQTGEIERIREAWLKKLGEE